MENTIDLLLLLVSPVSLFLQSEVNFLGRLYHPNLVRLLGYCWEEQELLLVYEYMQKGSLEHHLFGSKYTIPERLLLLITVHLFDI